MIKFRLYFDKDKETEWLNEMAANGYAMTGFFSGFYKFEKCTPGEYQYQIDLGNKLFSVSDDYREFMEETGAEIVQTWGFWVILRKKASSGDFQLYTDVDSSIAHYTKIRNMFKIVTIIELICFIVEAICVSENNYAAVAFMLLIGIFILVLMKATIRTNQIIQELKERKGDFSSHTTAKVSPILTAGLLLNAASLTIQDSVSSPIVLGIKIAAIAFMLIGIWQSRNVFRK